MSSRVMEVYCIKLNSVKGNFEMEAEVTKVEKPAPHAVRQPLLQEARRETPSSEGRDHG